MLTEFPGYSFLPSPYLPDLGYGKVEIYVSAKPLERFFDTSRVIFPVAVDGELRNLVINHPWIFNGIANPCRVCAGRFHLYETDGDEHLGFSLGGELEIGQDDDWVICQLTSPAPIFNLSEDPDSTNRWLADELEGFLARRRAAYSEDDSLFAERLQYADPLDLFIATLAELDRELRALPAAVRSSYQVQYNAIKHTIHLLEHASRWPAVPPLIENLL